MGNENDKGLVGRLKDVVAGDRIRLWRTTPGDPNNTYEVIGYVMQIVDRLIMMSEEHPHNSLPRATKPGGGRMSFHTYFLSQFDYYAKQVDMAQES